MKKVIATLFALPVVVVAYGQDANSEEIFRAVAVIFVMLALMVFVLTFLKKILEHRLKNKIVDKGIPENVITSLLQPTTGEEKNSNVKWFAILAGLGAGLLIVYYTKPLDIHSLAIMAFSISLSFLGYHLFLKSTRS